MNSWLCAYINESVISSLTLSVLHAGLGMRIKAAIPFIPFQLHVKINSSVNINETLRN
jgi:hypothetical protein